MLEKDELQTIVGNGVLVPMLTDGEKLVAFCTFAPRDEIWPTDLAFLGVILVREVFY